MKKNDHSIPFSVVPATEPGLHLRVDGFPAPLVGGPFPNRHQPDWLVLRKANVRHVVCLASASPHLQYDPLPAGINWLVCSDLPELADFVPPGFAEGKSSFFTDQNPELVKAQKEARANLLGIAYRVLSTLWSGEGVFVHCHYGIERTGLLIALTLTLGGSDRVGVVKKVAEALSQHMTIGDREMNLWLAVINATEQDTERGLGYWNQWFDTAVLSKLTKDPAPPVVWKHLSGPLVPKRPPRT
ncbi:MAG: Tyrosine phosphatase family [Verrucomicrobiota bacterium]|jgi:hypothetical protein